MTLLKFSLLVVFLFLLCLLVVEPHLQNDCPQKKNDHLVCYTIKEKTEREFIFNLIGNEYQNEYKNEGCKLLAKGKALEFCVPATKDFEKGEHDCDPCVGYTADDGEDCLCKELTDYLCYNIRCKRSSSPKREVILDQFDSSKNRRFSIKKVKRVCVPAWKFRKNSLVHVYDLPNCNKPTPKLSQEPSQKPTLEPSDAPSVFLICQNPCAAHSPYMINDSNYMDRIRSYQSIPTPINCWDTSQLTILRQAFRDMTEFNSDIQCWDTSKVTDMAVSYFCCDKLMGVLFWLQLCG